MRKVLVALVVGGLVMGASANCPHDQPDYYCAAKDKQGHCTKWKVVHKDNTALGEGYDGNKRGSS